MPSFNHQIMLECDCMVGLSPAAISTVVAPFLSTRQFRLTTMVRSAPNNNGGYRLLRATEWGRCMRSIWMDRTTTANVLASAVQCARSYCQSTDRFVQRPDPLFRLAAHDEHYQRLDDRRQFSYHGQRAGEPAQRSQINGSPWTFGVTNVAGAKADYGFYRMSHTHRLLR